MYFLSPVVFTRTLLLSCSKAGTGRCLRCCSRLPPPLPSVCRVRRSLYGGAHVARILHSTLLTQRELRVARQAAVDVPRAERTRRHRVVRAALVVVRLLSLALCGHRAHPANFRNVVLTTCESLSEGEEATPKEITQDVFCGMSTLVIFMRSSFRVAGGVSSRRL